MKKMITKLKKLKEKYNKCNKCPLAQQGRTQVVFGKGSVNTTIMFIGEAPGKNEDISGEPFTGKAGKLLNQILETVKIDRKDIYISNIIKCRPPKNRPPKSVEIKTCMKLILLKEIEIIKPSIICCLGTTATQAMLGNKIKISDSRGIFFEQTIKDNKTIKIIPTFHPAYLLRNPNAKIHMQEDLNKISGYLKIFKNPKKA